MNVYRFLINTDYKADKNTLDAPRYVMLKTTAEDPNEAILELWDALFDESPEEYFSDIDFDPSTFDAYEYVKDLAGYLAGARENNEYILAPDIEKLKAEGIDIDDEDADEFFLPQDLKKLTEAILNEDDDADSSVDISAYSEPEEFRWFTNDGKGRYVDCATWEIVANNDDEARALEATGKWGWKW